MSWVIGELFDQGIVSIGQLASLSDRELKGRIREMWEDPFGPTGDVTDVVRQLRSDIEAIMQPAEEEDAA